MKKIVVIFLLNLLCGCKSYQHNNRSNSRNNFFNFKRLIVLEEKEVNISQKNRAYELGIRMPTSCNTFKIKRYTTAEATEEIINNINSEKLSEICKGIHQKNGDFEGMVFMEAIYDKRKKNTIYRFKATYEKTVVSKEIRVTMNKKNKIAAITSRKWKEKYE